METNNNQTTFKKQPIISYFNILKTPKKKFIFYFKENHRKNHQEILKNFFSKTLPKTLKQGILELDTFLDNNLIDFVLIQVEPEFNFPTIHFGFKNDNDEIKIYKTYTDISLKFFKSKKQYWRCIFRLRDLSQELIEKHLQFHKLEGLSNDENI